MAYWLVKSEPLAYSIDQLAKDRRTLWDGVRNYQARNYLKSMAKGDEVLFYHSNAQPPAIVGVAKVSKLAVPDPTQFDSKDSHFDPTAKIDSPRWFCPELEFIRKFKCSMPLTELHKVPKLKSMLLLKKGSRLSVQPVTAAEFHKIMEISES